MSTPQGDRTTSGGALGSERPDAPVGEPTARLFVAVWPTDAVVRRLVDMRRPEGRAVRWTGSTQWHVTLAFLGEVAEARVGDLQAALEEAATGAAATEARLGPATTRYGRSVLGVPVAGLGVLAEAVRGALGVSPETDRPFRGHLTLARGRGGRPVPSRLVGLPLEDRWGVTEVCLVRSVLGQEGARYTNLVRATVPT